ncbi:MAG: tetratricopeptide repeat protein [Saprospiraceae bacterium]|nr:tetratricopeptide repeat protein [Saprospiraceae bacterium]
MQKIANNTEIETNTGDKILLTEEIISSILNNLENSFSIIELNINSLFNINESNFTDNNKAVFYFARGYYLFRIDDFENAVLDLNECLKIDKYYPEAYNNRGVIFNKLSRYKEAIEDFKIALELNPTYVFPWINMGNSFFHQEAYKDAVQCYTNAILMDESIGICYKMRGKAFYLLENIENACLDFKKAFNLIPLDTDVKELNSEFCKN